MCVIEHYQGEPTINHNKTSALTSVCPMLLNGGKKKKTHFLNQYLLHSPFAIREVSEHAAAFAHRAAGSGRKLSAGAGTVLSEVCSNRHPHGPCI